MKKINKNSVLLGLAMYLSRLKNYYSKQNENYEVEASNPSTNDSTTVLFPIWIVQHMPYSMYWYWRVFQAEKNELIVSAFTQYFDLEYQELVDYFNNVTSPEQMIQNILTMVAKRIQHGK